ncbi:glutamine--tRNA ligase [Blattabacterium cuenoti]|uniref:glutamine--tRNA ligase n=1 Tax=Blattabacterium cuenoti TaxID=1653831 RepID=UPI00163C26FA|nr:glutamine--tRNA ligase [Blattabacterium cuenoti]
MKIKSHLNFIEKIIEKDIENGFPRKKIKFRFPPEPNGYLHIGHVKAISLNFELAKKYQSPINLRFDDTNPIVENNKFIESIKKDILFLGFKWDKISYASDYFNNLYFLAIKLIKKNKAYIDNQSKEKIRFQRKNSFEIGINSNNRNRSIEENLYLFEKMKNGFFKEGSCVLRARIDMSSPNINMRDPIMYRILKTSHCRTGKKWCIYPTYDWTHGQCDYLERISHSLCSLEFENKRPLYNWFIDNIWDGKNIKPKQIEFSRLNLSNTITSKRKIQYLINKKIIHDWDDPRLSTISGLKNKGYPASSLINFVKRVGLSKRNNVIDISLLEFFGRESLKRISFRIMVILNPIKLVISNYPDNKTEWIECENFPNYNKKHNKFRKIPFSKNIYIESSDFLEKKEKNFFRLYIGNEVRLKNAYIIRANSIKKDYNGKIKEIYCTYDINSKSFIHKKKENNNTKKRVKSTLHWVSISHFIPINVNLFNPLFLNKNPNIEKNISNQISKNSIIKIRGYAEPSIKNYIEENQKYFQFQRIGYFYIVEKNNFVFNKTLSLKNK